MLLFIHMLTSALIKIFWCEFDCTSIIIGMKAELVHQKGVVTLPEPMLTQFTLTHIIICITRPQWVKLLLFVWSYLISDYNQLSTWVLSPQVNTLQCFLLLLNSEINYLKADITSHNQSVVLDVADLKLNAYQIWFNSFRSSSCGSLLQIFDRFQIEQVACEQFPTCE